MYTDKFYKIWNRNVLTQTLFWKSVASDNFSHYRKYYFETWGCFPKIWRWELKHLFSFLLLYADLNWMNKLRQNNSRKQKEIPREMTLLKHQHILL